MAGLRGAQLPSPPPPGPTRWRPSGRKAAARSLLPTSPLPAQSPEAKREEAVSQRGRAHNFAASGRARAGVQGSSCPRPELGEFVSPPLCGGAAAAARGAASPASRRRWPRSRRSPAPPASLRLPAVPPSAAGEAAVGNVRTAPHAPGPPGRGPRSGAWPGGCGRPPAERPSLPQPLSAFQAPRRIWRLLPRPPGDRRGEDTCFARDRRRGLSGVGSAAAAPGSARSRAARSPQRPPPGVLWAEPPRWRGSCSP